MNIISFIGTTEPGSSGSGLFNRRHQLIGQLYGGDASCSNPNGSDRYGALDQTWKRSSILNGPLYRALNPMNVDRTSIMGISLNEARDENSKVPPPFIVQ